MNIEETEGNQKTGTTQKTQKKKSNRTGKTISEKTGSQSGKEGKSKKIELDELGLQEKIDFHPHPAQQTILDGLCRFTTICAGTRFGKSALCAYIALRAAIKPNQHIWVVAPTYELSKKIYTYLARFTADAFPQAVKEGAIRMSDRMGAIKVQFKRLNTWIEFKSAENPTGLLGEELDLVIVDECSRTKKDVWESYLYSRLTSREGNAVFISTPFGKNWFYWEWMKGKDPQRPEYASFHYTSIDNPYFPIKEWDNAQKRLPTQVFKQEHMAVFLDDAASVFRGIREVATSQLRPPEPEHFYTMGVDLGKHEDFTVLTVIDRATHCVVHFNRFKDIDWPLQKVRIAETAKKYNGARITIDSTGIGDPITDDLRRMGLAVDDYKYTNKSKAQLIEKLSISIEQKRIYYPFIPELLDELEAFGYYLTPSGNTKYSAPEGLHDDCVNSLALAVWPLPDHPVSSGESTPILPIISDY